MLNARLQIVTNNDCVVFRVHYGTRTDTRARAHAHNAVHQHLLNAVGNGFCFPSKSSNLYIFTWQIDRRNYIFEQKGIKKNQFHSMKK